MRPYDLVTLLRALNEARTRAYDALEACTDPGAIIDEETYARAIEDAGIDPTGIVGVGDPVYMINIPSFMSIEIEAYTLLARDEREEPITEEEARWIEDTYRRVDVLRIFYAGITHLAQKHTREMQTK